MPWRRTCYSLILSTSITATLGIFPPWSSNIALLIGLYASSQALAILCPQSNQSALFKTKQIMSCPYHNPPMACYTTELLYPQALLSPTFPCAIVPCPSILTHWLLYISQIPTLNQSNHKAIVPAAPDELNSPSSDLSLENSLCGVHILN